MENKQSSAQLEKVLEALAKLVAIGEPATIAALAKALAWSARTFSEGCPNSRSSAGVETVLGRKRTCDVAHLVGHWPRSL
jgi:hypothetical protein